MSLSDPNPPQPVPRPNVLIVLMDDLGIEPLSAYHRVNAWPGTVAQTRASGLYANTPNLDLFAAQGLVFTNARALPICSPTRAGLYTGRYGMRTGVGALVMISQVSNTFIEFGVDVPAPMGGVVRERREYVLAEFAQAAGYKAGFFGKWHLALFGVDESIDQTGLHNKVEAGVLPGGVAFVGSGWDHFDQVGRWDHWFAMFRNLNQDPQPYSIDDKQDGSYGVPCAAAAGQHVRDGGWYARHKGDIETQLYNGPESYVEKVKVDEALAWMNQSANEPFVCAVALNLIHTPLHDPRPAGYPVRAVYGDLIDSQPADKAAWPLQMAMLEALDVEFGRLVNGLDPTLRARTLIIVTSDNGTQSTLKEARDVHGRVLGPTYDALVDATGDRFKGSIYEGGVHVPLFVQGPPDLVHNVPRSSTVLVDVHADVFDTVREVLRKSYSSVAVDGRRKDGISFRNVLLASANQGYGQHPRQFGFHHRFGANGAGDDATARDEIDDWAYISHIAGNATFKLLHRSGNYELYRLLSDTGTQTGADPFELTPLDINGAFQSIFNQLRTAAEALLATEFVSP
jgi:arylsulfatase A-like enzyme